MMLPEYSAWSAEPQQIAQIISQRGVVLLREALPVDLFASWLLQFAASFDAYDSYFLSGGMPMRDRLLYKYGHVDPEMIPGYFTDWMTTILDSSPLSEILSGYFGEKAHPMLKNCLPRRQGPAHPDHAIPYHQDLEFMGPMQKAITIWVPLTPSGGDWPGLEFWPDGPQIPLLSLAMEPAQRDKLCALLPQAALWRPHLQPGDLMLFTPYTVHRTLLQPNMTQTRISSELRLISSQDALNRPADIQLPNY